MTSVPGRALPRVAGASIVLVVAGLLGYLLGHHHPASVFREGMGLAYASPTGGTAYLGAAQIANRAPTGFAYGLPADVPWIDANDVTHDGGRPSCLPFYHAERVTMETVIYPIGDGGHQGTVLWVRC